MSKPQYSASVDSPSAFETGWPRIRRHAVCRDGNGSGPIRAFVLGRLELLLTVNMSGRLHEIAEAISTNMLELPSEWRAEASVAGFGAQAARAANDAGAMVWLSGTIPIPTLRLFELFFEDVDADTSHLRICPGPHAASIDLSARDGRLKISRRGVEEAVPPHIPENVFQDWDVILVGPCLPKARCTVLRKLRDVRLAKDRRATVAVVGSGDWSPEELSLVKSEHNMFVIFDRSAAIELARRVANVDGSIEQAARGIKRLVGDSSVIVAMGEEGALLLNNVPEPYLSRTGVPGNGARRLSIETLVATTLIEVAMGNSEQASLDRGVTAAWC